MYLRFGNLTPEAFAERVGTSFTPAELDTLNHFWSQNAKLTGADQFHIFDDPSITISIGSVDALPLQVFQAANARQPFNRPVSFYLDKEWWES